MSTLESLLRAEGINTNAKGNLSKEDFLRKLDLANQSGVEHYGKVGFNIVRDRFIKSITGDQAQEVLKSWNNGYDYSQNN